MPPLFFLTFLDPIKMFFTGRGVRVLGVLASITLESLRVSMCIRMLSVNHQEEDKGSHPCRRVGRE